jgi:o-succinylbenzoate synthase
MSSDAVTSQLRLTVEAVELRRVRLPLVAPFRTSFGTQTERDALLLRAVTSQGEGWGECVALRDPLYSSEYVDGAEEVLRRYLLPRLFAAGPIRAGELGQSTRCEARVPFSMIEPSEIAVRMSRRGGA